MRLYSTFCSTDWKCRPTHRLRLLGEGTLEELLAIRERDIREIKTEDLVLEALEVEALEGSGDSQPSPEKPVEDRSRYEQGVREELGSLSDEELHSRWKDDDRWTRFEMGPGAQREGLDVYTKELILFNQDGDRGTLVYHFVD